MSSATRWDTMPRGWKVSLETVEDPGSINRHYPLATKGGIQALTNLLAADVVWRNLTNPQRELLLSTAAGAPIKARADVERRLIERGLLVADPIFPEDGNPAALTEAGRFVVAFRPIPRRGLGTGSPQ